MAVIPRKPFIFEELAKKYEDISMFFTVIKPSLTAIFNELEAVRKYICHYTPATRSKKRNYTAFIKALPESIKSQLNIHPFYNLDAQRRMNELFYKNQTTRFYLKKLLFLWRNRKWETRQLNTDDPFTLYPPSKSIKLFDASSKGFYVFDESALLKHMQKALLHHNGPIDEPIYPKNPFTNLPFTKGQLKVIYDTFTSHHWIFDLFRTSKFSLGNLQHTHAYSLKKAALYATLHDKSSYFYEDFILMFIQQEYDELAQPYPVSSYDWAIKHYLDSDIMRSWEKLAKESALMDIEWECLNKAININKINRAAAKIIGDDYEIKKMNDAYLKWRREQADAAETAETGEATMALQILVNTVFQF